MKATLIFISIILYASVSAQSVELLTEGTRSSFRGLSVVNDNTVWVSGSNGMVGRSLDAGKTWKWMPVKGFEKSEFRDIEAFDNVTAVIMSIASPAYILRTVDGGETWKEVFRDTASAMFLDAMEFWNEQSGIVIGDPIGGRFYVARTFDGGRSWQPIPYEGRPLASTGEACFASSGTNIRKLTKSEAAFITGGSTSNLFIRNKKMNIPFANPKESVGANSLAVKSRKHMMVVGGDFYAKDDTINNCFFTSNGGSTWETPSIPPRGYRSCVEFIKKETWVTCGLNGAEITNDNGYTWKPLTSTGFHAVRKAKTGNAVFFAGGNGRIGKLLMP